MTDSSEIKDRQRAMWTAGDYPTIARWIEPASATVVASVGVGDTERVLDVATGTGNAALVAAALGAEVTGLDLTPKLIEVARRRAQEAELRVELLEGDAENLPFDDDSFDVVHAHQVLQHVGDPVVALREMMRVARPGGVVAVRDSDYAGFTWWPELAGLTRWLELYRAAARANGGEPDAGRRLLAWAHGAGATEVTASPALRPDRERSSPLSAASPPSRTNPRRPGSITTRRRSAP